MSGRAKLLLVDDEQEILEFLTLVFCDFDCKTALSVAAALELLKQEPFDLLVTDIKMPGTEGSCLINAARETLPDLPIVVITGHPQKMSEEIETKVEQWVLKPFDVETIRDAVIRSLRN